MLKRCVVILFAWVLCACGNAGTKSAGPGDPGEPAEAQGPPFLALIPADTPYALVALEPAPRAYIEREYVNRFGEAERLVGLFTDLRERNPEPFANLNVWYRLAFELLTEVKGKLSERGLLSLGIALDTRVAIYGIGILPAFRLELRNGAKFSAAVERVLRRTGLDWSAEFRGQRYWRARSPELGGFEVAIAVIGDELVAGLVDDATRAVVLPVLFGMEKPARSLADSGRLEDIRRRHGYARWGVGYIDLLRLARDLAGQGSSVGGKVSAALGVPLAEPACGQELPALVAPIPRIVFGSYAVDSQRVSGSFVVEMPPTVVAALRQLVAWVPGMNRESAGESMFSMGLGLSAARLIDYAGARLDAMAAASYACPALRELPAVARETRQALGMAGPVASITGINVIVQLMLMDENGELGSAEGYAFLGTEQPSALLQLASQALGINLGTVKDDSVPVRLNIPGVSEAVGETYMAASPRAIGVSVGSESRNRLGKILVQPPADDPPLLFCHISPPLLAAVEQKDIADEHLAIAQIDPDLARALTASDQAGYDRYEDMLVVGRMTERGFELRFDVVYRDR